MNLIVFNVNGVPTALNKDAIVRVFPNDSGSMVVYNEGPEVKSFYIDMEFKKLIHSIDEKAVVIDSKTVERSGSPKTPEPSLQASSLPGLGSHPAYPPGTAPRSQAALIGAVCVCGHRPGQGGGRCFR
jgi:hypothetical protein